MGWIYKCQWKRYVLRIDVHTRSELLWWSKVCSLFFCNFIWACKSISLIFLAHRRSILGFQIILELNRVWEKKYYFGDLKNLISERRIETRRFLLQSYGKTEKHHDSWNIDFSYVIHRTKNCSSLMWNRYPWWIGPARIGPNRPGQDAIWRLISLMRLKIWA